MQTRREQAWRVRNGTQGSGFGNKFSAANLLRRSNEKNSLKERGMRAKIKKQETKTMPPPLAPDARFAIICAPGVTAVAGTAKDLYAQPSAYRPNGKHNSLIIASSSAGMISTGLLPLLSILAEPARLAA